MKKSMFSLVLSVLIVASLLFTAAGCAREKKLSAMSREDQLEFLAEQGIDIPAEYEDFAINFIARVEEEPDRDYAAAVSDVMIHDLSLQIQEAVCEYYGYEYSPVNPLWLNN